VGTQEDGEVGGGQRLLGGDEKEKNSVPKHRGLKRSRGVRSHQEGQGINTEGKNTGL